MRTIKLLIPAIFIVSVALTSKKTLIKSGLTK